MQTRQHQIRRGSERPEIQAEQPKLSLVPTKIQEGESSRSQAPAGAADVSAFHDRLDALERLGRLREQQILSADEFAAEKAFILGRVDVIRGPFEAVALRSDKAGPQVSLLGRMLSWKFVPIGLVGGLALSFGIQPQETVRFFEQASSLLGA